jgi:5'-3' exonuclease
MNKRPPKNGEIIKKTQNTLLVDGNALFKTGFFGAKDSYNIHGNHIGGLYQFMTTLRMLLTEDLYHRVYVFWDGNFSGKLRYEIYKPYKSDRGKDYENGTQPIDESELSQRARTYEYLNELYVRQLKHEVIESDDFIAYYCLNKKENEKITICTNDSDMAQLVDENVRIYFLNFKQYVDKTNFSSYFCYHYQNAAVVKLITGDTADSIKGIKNVGTKTLVKIFPELVERKVSLTEILEKAEQLQEERKTKKQKPLVALDNIINRVTDGVQGDKIYEINYALVNLKQPMMTEDGIEELHNLIEGTLHEPVRDIQKVFKYINEDGLRITIGESRYEDYLSPFKKLKQREDLIF